mmetsp:Transcript_15460/g.46397  ORF Transcript_15460/g.46397 Transcript_15460/m.46397 type:complete len:721 (+) Transcript_15460:196-2358(+)
MAPRLARFVLAMACFLQVARCDVEIASPVRRIVNMLRMMSAKADARRKQEEDVFSKFQCYCDTQMDMLKKSESGGSFKVSQLEAGIKETKASIGGLETELKGQKSDRDATVTALKEATEIRRSDKFTFEKGSAALKENIKALAKAIGVLTKAQQMKDETKSNSIELLQGGTAAYVRNVADSIWPDVLRSTDRQSLSNLLQTVATMGTEDIPEVLSVLSTMLDDMRDDLKSMTDDEYRGLASFQALEEAKNREKTALTTAIQEKRGRHSSMQVELARMKVDLDDTKSGMESSSHLSERLRGQCERKAKDYAARKTALADEQIALSDTIKLLSDERLEKAFSKTVRSVSFLQRSATARRGSGETRKAVEMLRQMSKQHPDRPELGLLAAKAAKVAKLPRSGLTKLGQLIDQMLEALAQEQQDDSLKREMCLGELRRNGEHQSKVKEGIDARGADLATAQDQLTFATREVDALRASIASLDHSVDQATKERQEANNLFVQVIAENHAAIDLLQEAKMRLIRYYDNVKQAALIQEKERSIQQHVHPGGVDAFVEEVGVLASDTHAQEAAHDAEATVTTLKQHADSVVEMIGAIQDGLGHEFDTAKAQEAKDQADYEDLMTASKAKRSADAKALTERAGATAAIHETSLKVRRMKRSLEEDLAATEKVVANLRGQCDGPLKNYDVREAARKAETEALRRTKAVLAKAANSSLAQASAKPSRSSKQ